MLRKCLTNVIISGILFFLWGTAAVANPMPPSQVFVDKGPGAQDVTFADSCVEDVYDACYNELPLIYRDGNKIDCKWKEILPQKKAFYYENSDMTDDDVSDAADVYEPRDTYHNDIPPGRQTRYIEFECIDTCVPIGVHEYRIEGYIEHNNERVDSYTESVKIDARDPKCPYEPVSTTMFTRSTYVTEARDPKCPYEPVSTADCSTSFGPVVPGRMSGIFLFLLLFILWQRHDKKQT